MLIKLLDEHEIKCFLCNDEPAIFKFGEYGKGIGEDCVEALREMVKE